MTGFRAISTATLNSGGTTVNVTCPSSAVVGDVMFLLSSDGAGPWTGVTITGGAGGTWLHATTFPVGGSATQVGGDCWYKTVEAGDPGATITVAWTETGQKAAVAIVVYFEVDTAAPIHQVSGKFQTTANTAWSTNAVTTTIAAWILSWVGVRDSSIVTTSTQDQGETERADVTATGSSNVSIAVYDSNGDVASGSISRSGVISQSLRYVAGIIAIKPAASGVVGAATEQQRSGTTDDARKNGVGAGTEQQRSNTANTARKSGTSANTGQQRSAVAGTAQKAAIAAATITQRVTSSTSSTPPPVAGSGLTVARSTLGTTGQKLGGTTGLSANRVSTGAGGGKLTSGNGLSSSRTSTGTSGGKNAAGIVSIASRVYVSATGQPAGSLPGPIPGVSAETQEFTGPTIDANGNLYTVTETDVAGGNRPRMFRSTDGGTTWVEQDVANRPSGSDLEALHMAKQGAVIHQVVQRSGGNVHYATFNTSEAGTNPDTWQLNEPNIFTATAAVQGTTCVPLTNGDVWAFWHDDGGAKYAKRSGGTWGSATVITGATRGCVAVRGASNLMHIFYNDVSNNIQHRSLSSTGTLSAAEQVNDTAGHTVYKNLANPVYYDDGGAETIVVAWANSSGHLRAARVVNDGTPSAEETVNSTVCLTDPGYGNVALIASLAVDEVTDTVFLLWAQSSDRDLYYQRSVDGAAWTAATEIADAVTCDWIHGASVLTHSVGNGGQKVLGWVFNDNVGNNEFYEGARYDELVLTESKVGAATGQQRVSVTTSGRKQTTADGATRQRPVAVAAGTKVNLASSQQRSAASSSGRKNAVAVAPDLQRQSVAATTVKRAVGSAVGAQRQQIVGSAAKSGTGLASQRVATSTGGRRQAVTSVVNYQRQTTVDTAQMQARGVGVTSQRSVAAGSVTKTATGLTQQRSTTGAVGRRQVVTSVAGQQRTAVTVTGRKTAIGVAGPQQRQQSRHSSQKGGVGAATQRQAVTCTGRKHVADGVEVQVRPTTSGTGRRSTSTTASVVQRCANVATTVKHGSKGCLVIVRDATVGPGARHAVGIGVTNQHLESSAVRHGPATSVVVVVRGREPGRLIGGREPSGKIRGREVGVP